MLPLMRADLLVPHLHDISTFLDFASNSARLEISKMLAKLLPVVLMQDDGDRIYFYDCRPDDTKLQASKMLGMLAPEILAPSIGSILMCLECASDGVKREITKALGKLTPELLAPYVGTILRSMECPSNNVKVESSKALGMLTPLVLAPYIEDVIMCLECSSRDVKVASLRLLGTLAPDTIAPFLASVLKHLERYSDDAKIEVCYILTNMTPEKLLSYVAEVLGENIKTEHYLFGSRLLALKRLGALSTLTPEVNAPYVEDILACLKRPSRDAKFEALKMLGSLTPELISPSIGNVLICLECPSDNDKYQVSNRLGMRASEVLAPYVRDIFHCLRCLIKDMQLKAFRSLDGLRPTLLAPHAGNLLICFECPSDDAKFEVSKVLQTLTPAILLPCGGRVLRCLKNASDEIKLEALRAAGRLTPEDLAPCVVDILRCLECASGELNVAAAQWLGTLPVEVLAPCAKDMLGCLKGSADDVKIAASKALARSIPDIKLEALKLLDGIPQDVLVPHVEFILECLCDSVHDVIMQSFRLLHTVGSLHLQGYSAWRGPGNNSALHIAASIGDVKSCDLLTRAGYPNKVKNAEGKSPVDIAKLRRHSDVVDFFARSDHLSATRVGSGDAWAQALADTRCVTKVVWYAVPLQGFVGSCGGLHSLICIFVGSPGCSHAYVIEKADRIDDGTDQFKNGVHVSHWVDIGPKLDSDPYNILEDDDVISHTCIRFVWDVAVNTGPYSLGASNCHHAAKAVFNACAREHARTSRMPNVFSTVMARAFNTLGVPLQRCGQSTSCASESLPLVSQSNSNLYGAGTFPMGDSMVELVDASYEHTIMAAKLSAWIYDAGEVGQPQVHFQNSFGEKLAIYIEESKQEMKLNIGASGSMKISSNSVNVRVNYIGLLGGTSRRTRLLRFEARCDQKYRITPGPKSGALYEQCNKELLPEGAQLKHLHLVDDGNVVQWAIALVDDTAYIVFKGTSEIADHLINTTFLTCDDAHGLRVHGGMWLALHQTRRECKHHTIKLIIEQVRLLHPRHIVTCGHSLGGGYAILATLELLANSSEIASVLTFGAPQVVVPDFRNPLWKKLDDITTLYVNSYDIIPRLPSFFVDWSRSIPLCGGPLACSLDLSSFHKKRSRLKEFLADYDTVGTLAFICSGSSKTRQASSTDESHKELLGRLPEPVGPFILTQHNMSEYLDILLHARKCLI